MTMHNQDQLIDALDRRVERRNSRRDFVAALAAGGAVLAAAQAAQAQTPSEADVLNFALNLEYLEAQFYLFATTGAGLPDASLTGTGTQGAVIGGRKVNFTDNVVRQYANEIAADEAAHVNFLRTALGNAKVAQPAIDIRGGAADTPFGAAASAAGLSPTFDPYASDEEFLLGAFIFEDVGVTAYKGAAALLPTKSTLEAAAGILAAEAYHAGLVRTVLYRKGVATPDLRVATVRISDARDTLDGPSDLDQGIIGPPGESNIVPLDANGVAFSRTPGQVLNIVYLNNRAVTAGGFFPAGVNGAVRTSAAN